MQVWIVGFGGNGIFAYWNGFVELGFVYGLMLEDIYFRGHCQSAN